MARHRSWASDTVVTAVLFVILLAVTVVIDTVNGSEPAPAYLTGLLGAAGAALFGAAGSDKSKRDREVEAKAERAERRTLSLNEDIVRTERKADELAELAAAEHPDADVPEPLIRRRKDPDEQGIT